MKPKLYKIQVIEGGVFIGNPSAGDLRTLRNMVDREEYLFIRTSKDDLFHPDGAYYINTNHIVWISEVQEKD